MKNDGNSPQFHQNYLKHSKTCVNISRHMDERWKDTNIYWISPEIHQNYQTQHIQMNIQQFTAHWQMIPWSVWRFGGSTAKTNWTRPTVKVKDVIVTSLLGEIIDTLKEKYLWNRSVYINHIFNRYHRYCYSVYITSAAPAVRPTQLFVHRFDPKCWARSKGNIYRKQPCLMGKNILSCRFFSSFPLDILEPIHVDLDAHHIFMVTLRFARSNPWNCSFCENSVMMLSFCACDPNGSHILLFSPSRNAAGVRSSPCQASRGG